MRRLDHPPTRRRFRRSELGTPGGPTITQTTAHEPHTDDTREPTARRVALAVLVLLVVAVGVLLARPDPGPDVVDPDPGEAEPDTDPRPDADPPPGPGEPRDPTRPEVLWSGDFDSHDWQDEFGVVVESRTNTQVLAEGPDGRSDVLAISFGGEDERWGMDYRHDLDQLGLPELEHVHFAYDVYFSEDFEFIGDGKLGGLAGIADDVDPLETAAGGDYDERSFSVRAMWKEDRGVVMYLYARQAAGRDFWHPEHYGFGIAEPFVASDGRTSEIFTPGQWHRVEHRIQLNTPGEPDGIYELWVDQHRGISLDDVEYRTADQPDLQINQLMSTWFFGGGSDEFPTRPNVAYTDNWSLAVPNDPTTEYVADRKGADR